MEKRLQQSQKMEATGTLTGGIAHDFNNILSSILGFTELAKMRGSSDEKLQSNLNHVIASGLRVKDPVNQILTFSRRAETQKVVITMAPIRNCRRPIIGPNES